MQDCAASVSNSRVLVNICYELICVMIV